MKRPHFIRLCDMRDVIDEMQTMFEGVDLATYRADPKLRRATERCVEIISEASRHIPPQAKADFPEIPWHEIASIGNLLRHEYQIVSDVVMWKIGRQSLSGLRRAVFEMIQKSEAARSDQNDR